MDSFFSFIIPNPKKVSYLFNLLCRIYLDSPYLCATFLLNLIQKVFNQKNQVLKYNNNYNNNANINLFYEGEKELFSYL